MRFLFLADTHLGLDLPKRPKVKTFRRGDDFWANFQLALEPALRGEVDFVLHGGDLFDRSQPPVRVIWDAANALLQIADKGIPVFLVPGNHERSWIPGALLFGHPNLHLFLEASTHRLEIGGESVSISSFSFIREGIRDAFGAAVEGTGWRDVEADLRLLLVHQTFYGATVGTGNYTFRYGDDIIPLDAIPPEIDLVTAGHIHRHQGLCDAAGRLRVLYPGSTERTAFAELLETKGYVLGEFSQGKLDWQFVELPTRPMIGGDFKNHATPGELAEAVQAWFAAVPDHGMARMRIFGPKEWDRPVQLIQKILYREAKARNIVLSLSCYMGRQEKPHRHREPEKKSDEVMGG